MNITLEQNQIMIARIRQCKNRLYDIMPSITDNNVKKKILEVEDILWFIEGDLVDREREE